MVNTAKGLGRDPLRKSLADWGSRIAGGEVPPAPPRPSGVERNMVITQWAWGQDLSYIHDSVSTDKRNPTLYPYGKVWGIDIGQSYLWALDPVKHTISSHEVPRRDGPGRDPERPGRIQGRTSSHNPMLDDKGNVWLTTSVRDFKVTPPWVLDVMQDIGDPTGASMKSLPPRRLMSSRQLGYFDTKAEKYVLIDTAFATHHLQFDWQGRLWTSGDGSRLGMFDPSKFDPNRPVETEAGAQIGWTQVDPEDRQVGDGRWLRHHRQPEGRHCLARQLPGHLRPGAASRSERQLHRPVRSEEPHLQALPDPAAGIRSARDRRDDRRQALVRDRQRPSGALRSRDRAVQVLGDAGAQDQDHRGKETGSADFHYYIWVDQFDTLGLGKDMVILNGTNSDSLLVFNPTSEQFTVIRFRILSGCSLAGSTAASTMRRRGGRDVVCGCRTTRTVSCTPRRGAGTSATCSSGPTRWPAKSGNCRSGNCRFIVELVR